MPRGITRQCYLPPGRGDIPALNNKSAFSFLRRCKRDTALTFAAERRAAVDVDRQAAAPAADAPCSNRSISPASAPKPAAEAQDGTDRQTDGQTDRQTDGQPTVT